MKGLMFALIVLLFAGNTLAAQEGFGFDDEDGAVGASAGLSVPSVKISGEAGVSLTGFIDDFDDAAKVNMGDVFSGKLNFSASGTSADAVINLKLKPSATPFSLDEAYVRAFFGSLSIEGGLRKLTWGRADTLGPLDVINPLDYSDLTGINDASTLKIARPLLHASYTFGSFTKLEAVFVPLFEGHRLATTGRWMTSGITLQTPDTFNLKYAGAGMRFTTTISSADIGAQYYYGHLFNIAISNITPIVDMTTNPPNITGMSANIDYNRYHQIGVDYAQVLVGFNVRAEFAANLTEDLAGDDATVYNPHLAWSLGFDRDLFWGINANIEGVGTVRLFDSAINPLFDVEAGTDMTATRIIARLSKKFLRDELELQLAGMWNIEAGDFILIPVITWTKGDIELELSAGIFGGDEKGQFGQYHKNNFVKVAMTYTF
ncbi:MAG: hypothetical protein LBT13_02490 [Treponema sp.]|jgi:hypothetical protein|nr:hypothetical protein [Treponema sp.]